MKRVLLLKISIVISIFVFCYFVDVWIIKKERTQYEKDLEIILGKCLGEKEGVLWIEDKQYLCHAIPTGEERK